MSGINTEKTIKDIFEYAANGPGILQVSHDVNNIWEIVEEYDFRTRQMTSMCLSMSYGAAGVTMFRQNFRDIERQEVVEEMRAKLIELGGDPDRYTTSVDGRNKRALVPPKV